MKKIYTTPRLTVHGSVQKITLSNHHNGNHNHGNPNNNPNDPRLNCNQGQGSFCS
jgi:hypothetical protein